MSDDVAIQVHRDPFEMKLDSKIRLVGKPSPRAYSVRPYPFKRGTPPQHPRALVERSARSRRSSLTPDRPRTLSGAGVPTGTNWLRQIVPRPLGVPPGAIAGRSRPPWTPPESLHTGGSPNRGYSGERPPKRLPRQSSLPTDLSPLRFQVFARDLLDLLQGNLVILKILLVDFQGRILVPVEP